MFTNQKLAHAFTYGWLHTEFTMLTTQCKLDNQNFAATSIRSPNEQKGVIIADAPSLSLPSSPHQLPATQATNYLVLVTFIYTLKGKCHGGLVSC